MSTTAFGALFTDLCTQTVVWEPITGRDQYGKAQFGTPQTFIGRRNSKLQRVSGHNGQGAEVLSPAQIIILSVVPVKYDDRVYIQGDTAPFPAIVSVNGSPDESGTDQYTKVFLGSTSD